MYVMNAKPLIFLVRVSIGRFTSVRGPGEKEAKDSMMNRLIGGGGGGLFDDLTHI